MRIQINHTDFSYVNVDDSEISDVILKGTIYDIFSNESSSNGHNVDIKVPYLDYKNDETMDGIVSLFKEKLVDRINDGSLVFKLNTIDYVRDDNGNITNSVIHFTTFSTEENDNINIYDTFTATYADFQTNIASGLQGIINDLKGHFIEKVQNS